MFSEFTLIIQTHEHTQNKQTKAKGKLITTSSTTLHLMLHLVRRSRAPSSGRRETNKVLSTIIKENAE